MISCRELLELLLDYLAEELPETHCDEIRQHLCACRRCEVFVQTYQITIHLTRKLPCKPLPPDVAERLRAKLQEGEGTT
jgi:hypothetical protein